MLPKAKRPTKKPDNDKRRSVTVRLGEITRQQLEDLRHFRSREDGKNWSSNAVMIELIEEAHKATRVRPRKAANG